MTSFSGIDMTEVTRLTRQGRLKEAMALLKGSAAAPETPRPETLRPEARPGAAGPSTREELRRTGTRTARPNRAERAGAGSVAPERFAEHQFRCEAGSRPYRLYVPASLDERHEPVPLLVMLHGCTQSPDDFARGTRMNTLAERDGFLVLYPGQTKSANMSKCWNWFSPADQRRGTGEPAIIAGMVREVMANHAVDPARVFAAGLSAGGAAAAILGQNYPDLFAAIGVHSGLACGAAKDMPSAFAAMKGQGAGPGGGRAIPAIVFQGSADTTVAPANAGRVGAQALGGARTTQHTETGRSPGGVSYTRIVHQAPEVRRPLLETWTIVGLGHAWSGGSADGTYTDPKGPDASAEMIRFFGEVAGAPLGSTQ
ncbi:esterase [Fulvimarina endophytica]|uniref:Esterase n=1 Tax=Fulvimarina endophytica TaxID=2293836 RepID=A0A371WZA8_9HYPH|nr:PHB depolymerase family esterase [Fulvimarina endophytica]RFC62104.1 esterase [Fulvimarina endophytica]